MATLLSLPSFEPIVLIEPPPAVAPGCGWDDRQVEIEVVGAVIVRDGLVLCARRGPGGATSHLWEFPGGKIEPDEAPEAALAREILEELGCHVRVGELVTTTRHEYDELVIVLSTYWCELVDGVPAPSEHEAVVWLAPAELGTLDWAPADRPAVALVALARDV